ncbi:hypothetical protein [Fusobacterium varium]|uniref:hypothetical protein n=1 Tax=Fusobacterium varium TaxID=856 RepID=UPI0022E35F12|nr:hypothetical protein [Fusobacterium varium]
MKDIIILLLINWITIVLSLYILDDRIIREINKKIKEKSDNEIRNICNNNSVK